LNCDQKLNLNIGGSCHWVDELLFRKNKRLFDS
jgi:hypothetical protein